MNDKRNHNFTDISGQLFGDWIEIEYDRVKSLEMGRSYYKCTCKCERIVFVSKDNLIKKKRQNSCSHCKDIIIGKKYNYLRPIGRVKDYTNFTTGNRAPRYKCVCSYKGKGCIGFVEVRGCHIRSGETKSCGCLHKEIVSGENNFNWKGGVSSLYERIRSLSESKRWKKGVFKRDNYTCQKCGKRGCFLEAHHAEIAFCEICKKYNIADSKSIDIGLEKARNCEELWNIENGSTLCGDCHKEFHSIFGIKNWSREVFMAWLYS